jgi:hypothetical protein
VRRGLLTVAASAILALAAPSGALASGPPILGEAWSSSVLASSARITAQINPNGINSFYRFEYIKQAAYEANIAAAKDPFAGALKSPLNNEGSAAVGGPPTYTALLSALTPATPYRYRITAKNSAGSEVGAAHLFITQATAGPLLPDSRAWEMVSPVDKNGGQVDPPGAIADGGVLQAAAGGQAITYGSSASFAGGEGAPPASQYLATRSPDGWSTQNLTAPIFSGTYGLEDQGVPYQLFSEDLARGLLLNGEHCRGGAAGCAVANPPLGGTGAPEGYQDYYLREASGFASLVSGADILNSGIGPAHFDLRLAGASSDLRHVILSSCAALTADATEMPLGESCDPSKANLYEWSQGQGLSLVNSPPAEPGAALAASAGAVSADGSRVYWKDTAAGLHLRDGSQVKLVDGSGGVFQIASTDGSVAFYLKAEHLYRYQAQGSASTDLTPTGGVKGVLGASANGSYLYYQDAGALRLWHEGAIATVANGSGASLPEGSPPATGAARVSPDGTKLLFGSKDRLTGFNNTDLITGQADAELFLYDAISNSLACVSCNPTNERPIGAASVPGAIANGTAAGSTDAYKPRALSSDGKRVFFDSADTLAPTDVNTLSASGGGIADAYQWEAQGEGSCTKQGGCIALISSGRSPGGASFIDASTDGSDAFFITGDSLVKADPGAVDLYDARVGGGFAEPSPPIPCEGDACQFLPSEPTDPTLATLLEGLGNPRAYYRKFCKSGYVKKKGICVKKHGKAKPRHKGSKGHRRHGGHR